MVARHQKESRQVQARSGNETYYRYLDTNSERLVTSAIDCATGQLSGAATAEPYPNTIVNSSVLTTDTLTNTFYIDSGASAHLVPTKCGLRNYVKFDSPVEIAAANNRKILAYGSGTVRMAVSVGGVEREADLEDVYYVPDVHVRLLSMGKLESQGWVIQLKDGAMELWDRLGDLFAVVS